MCIRDSPTPISCIVLNASWMCVRMKWERRKISPQSGGSGGGLIGADVAYTQKIQKERKQSVSILKTHFERESLNYFCKNLSDQRS